MSTYITSADITDMIINDFSTALTAKLTLSDSAVVDMADQKGVDSTSISTSPVHWLVKRWAVAWVCRELCLDALGKNNVEVADFEKYRIKYDIYNKILNETESQITPSVLIGASSVNINDRATLGTAILFRS